jgi:hypothetical protein
MIRKERHLVARRTKGTRWPEGQKGLGGQKDKRYSVATRTKGTWWPLGALKFQKDEIDAPSEIHINDE